MQDKTKEQLITELDELRKRCAELEEGQAENKRAEDALQSSEKRYRRLFESAKDGILILDADTGKVVDVNPFLLQLLGYSYDALCGEYIWEIGVFKDIAASKDAFKVLQDNEYIRYDNLPLETIDGKPIAVEFVSNVYLVDHAKVIQCNIRDITERKRAEVALFNSRQMLRSVLDNIPQRVFWKDLNSVYLGCNKLFILDFGYEDPGEIVGKTDYEHASAATADLYRVDDREVMESGRPKLNYEEPQIRPDGTQGWLITNKVPMYNQDGQVTGVLGTYEDITERKRAEEEREKLQAQLNQMQKMESVGRLAGGVAHDFNNMLGVILGHTEMAMAQIDSTHPLHADLQEIQKAANRSADLTRQLLAFARKQTAPPKVLDLNETVEGMLKMLRRLIGEDIDLAWLPARSLWPVNVDPSQIDQILANLCVNAKDAIGGVGKLTIETGGVTFDTSYCANHAGAVAGEYVLLAVSDNGCGMDEETRNRIFDPFFTTKEVGKGTGLGLATVYGIVKQNNGYINVYSEPGHGTTFKIYLPRHAGEIGQELMPKALKISKGRGETVLLVEDEPAILQMTKTMLQRIGYNVLAASTPGEAMRLAKENTGDIRLLITDVVMPEMNGRDLAAEILSLYPNLKSLFMSGYTSNVIAHQGVLDVGVKFIQKPFSMKDLAAKVRAALRDK
jgi:PAS domain S-box-containing protein